MKLIGPETVSQGCIRPVGNGTNSADLRAITRIIFYRCLFKFVAVSGLIEKETHEKGIGN